MEVVKRASCVFVMLFNVPCSYRSSTLRNFFGQLVESNKFVLFHYRHRPMRNYDVKEQSFSVASTSSTTSSSSTTSAQTDTKSSQDSTSPCCCLILCELETYKRLNAAYHLHHWKDEKNVDLPSQCHIYPVHCIINNPSDAPWDLAEDYTIKPECEDTNSGQLSIPYEELMKFKEMSPPDIMPQGNIGTPTRHYLELINSCRLPPIIVKKLGLKFKKGQDGKMYSSVPFDYNNPAESSNLPGSHMMIGPAVTSLNHKIIDHSEYLEAQILKNTKVTSKKKPVQDQPKTTKTDKSDDEAEEWDRHEQFYDDPANYEKNKERLYEEKIELKWEKGGSGLVFYTDAQYWKQLEGDFDEQTADDWDVDMSEYDELGTGDKDARDFLAMRAENRLRDGKALREETSVFAKPIGSFERHTKGVGRTLLQKQGWTEGKGVGKGEDGRAHIIDTDGKHPRDRKGFGFHGEKVNRYVTRKRPTDQPIIATVYDNPEELHQSEPLTERSHHLTMKYKKQT